jgi:acetoin utilization deacetylase AcuC-like enzyme
LRRNGKFKDVLAPRDASVEEVGRVHEAGYIDLVRAEVSAMRDRAGYLSTGDTAFQHVGDASAAELLCGRVDG